MRILPFSLTACLPVAMLLAGVPSYAATFTFNSGLPDGLVGMGSRPASTGVPEVEAADDFVLAQATRVDRAKFYGLLPEGSTVTSVRLEIYRLFPKDSTNPPSGHVPTRDNSPSDVAFAEREADTLSYSLSSLGAFTVGNSVLNGIDPIPNQTTGGEGAVSGQQVLFDVALASPFVLPADHYFFIPQVQLDTGAFLWLSAAKPIAGGTGPFDPDLQTWIRDEGLAPDWLRVGTDVIGGQAFNASFELSGETVAAVPLPASGILLGVGLLGLLAARRRDQAGHRRMGDVTSMV